MDEALRLELARGRERLGPFADRVRWFDEVASTNDVAMALAVQGADEGCVVAAGAQSSGKGRLGRRWSSPQGAGIYVSVVLRPPAHAIPLITLATGVAVAEGVEAAAGLSPALKWPNDLYAPGTNRKLGGILAERAGLSSTACIVIGVGINVRPAPHAAGVADRVASLEGELGRHIDTPMLLVECLASLWRRYSELRDHRGRVVLDAWRARARSMMGRIVEWDGQGGVERGLAEGVDDSGALLVRQRTDVIRIISGEVRWMSDVPVERGGP